MGALGAGWNSVLLIEGDVPGSGSVSPSEGGKSDKAQGGVIDGYVDSSLGDVFLIGAKPVLLKTGSIVTFLTWLVRELRLGMTRE